MPRLTIVANGESFAGATRIDCVKQMRDYAWKWDDTKREYMQAVAVRVGEEKGVSVVFETVDDFVDILVGLGYLVETEDD